MSELKLPDPFVGPQPFSRQDAWRFFGRDDAADELFSLLLASRSLLLYSQSGAGKTSLVNAGLLPAAQKEGFDILPPARVQGVVPEGVPTSALGNPYTYFTLASFDVDADTGRRYSSLAEALRARDRPRDPFGDPVRRLIVLDQFEELFTSFPEHWHCRPAFIEDLCVALGEDPFLHVVFCLREDHLADMLSLSTLLPDRLRTRFRLSRLRGDEAVAAIEGPVHKSGASFAEGVVDRLVRDLKQIRVESTPGVAVEVAGEFVEPVQLQVVCTSLWRSLPPGTPEITDEHVRRFGDVSSALGRFYEEAVAEAARGSELSEATIREWFQTTMITPADTRGMAYRGPTSTAGLDNRAVDILVDRHMVRAELRAGSRWYELTHDRFIGPIQASNARVQQAAESPRYWGLGLLLLALAGAVGLAVLGSQKGAVEALLRFVLAGAAAVGLAQLASGELQRSEPRRFVAWLAGGWALALGITMLVGGLATMFGTPKEYAGRPFDDYLAIYASDLPDSYLVDCGGSNLGVFVNGPDPTVDSAAELPDQLERLDKLADEWCLNEASNSMIVGPISLWLGLAMSYLAGPPIWHRRRDRKRLRREARRRSSPPASKAQFT